VSDPINARILLADDEPLYLQATSQLLRKAGYDCVCVADAAHAMEVIRHQSIDLVLTDLNMPGNLKLELLRAGRHEWPALPLIVVTGVPSLPTAIESVRLGIADYLVKPVKFEVLLQSIRRVLQHASLPVVAPGAVHPGASFSHVDRPLFAANKRKQGSSDIRFIGSSEPMRKLFELIDRVSQSDANVLISGESGTGKELVAKAIHDASARRDSPFQIIDCTAIPESLFESILFGHIKGSFTGAVDDQTGLLAKADLGTAFFDEMGELPMTLQPKLLRVIQEQTYIPLGKSVPRTLNTRFICATNRNLLHEVDNGRFRRDLFYRLSVLHLEIPPLRKRDDDVVELAQHFLESFRGSAPLATPVAQGFTDACLERLRRYTWPGNVRELRNAVESSVALCDGPLIDVIHLPEWIRDESSSLDAVEPKPTSSDVSSLSRNQARGTTDKQYFESLMRQYNGNISQAARHAQLSRQTLHKLLNKHRIEAADFRAVRSTDRLI